jgi:hypothetical protein
MRNAPSAWPSAPLANTRQSLPSLSLVSPGIPTKTRFHQDALLDASVAALGKVVEASPALAPLPIVGAPLLVEEKLFNCAVAVYHGAILGATPKTPATLIIADGFQEPTIEAAAQLIRRAAAHPRTSLP